LRAVLRAIRHARAAARPWLVACCAVVGGKIELAVDVA
jgi:hypothetical protein